LNKSSYLESVSDLEAKGYSATLITGEISLLGHSLPVCHKAIQKSFHQLLAPLFVPSLKQQRRLLFLPHSQYLWLTKNFTGHHRDHSSLDCSYVPISPLVNMCILYNTIILYVIIYMFTPSPISTVISRIWNLVT